MPSSRLGHRARGKVDRNTAVRGLEASLQRQLRLPIELRVSRKHGEGPPRKTLASRVAELRIQIPNRVRLAHALTVRRIGDQESRIGGWRVRGRARLNLEFDVLGNAGAFGVGLRRFD